MPNRTSPERVEEIGVQASASDNPQRSYSLSIAALYNAIIRSATAHFRSSKISLYYNNIIGDLRIYPSGAIETTRQTYFMHAGMLGTT